MNSYVPDTASVTHRHCEKWWYDMIIHTKITKLSMLKIWQLASFV